MQCHSNFHLSGTVKTIENYRKIALDDRNMTKLLASGETSIEVVVAATQKRVKFCIQAIMCKYFQQSILYYFIK
jgi:hypothetical protein